MAYNEELSIKVQLNPDEGKSKDNINGFIKEMNQKNNLSKLSIELDLNKTSKTVKALDTRLEKLGDKFKNAFTLDADTIKGFKQLEKTFKEFNKMTKASQKALSGYFNDVEQGIKDVQGQAKKLENTLDDATKGTKNFGKAMNDEVTKVVRYTEAGLDKVQAVFTQKKNERDTLITTVMGDGSQLHKTVADIEGAMKRTLSQYDKTYKAINKYEENYRKASLSGDTERQRVIGEALEKQFARLSRLDKMVTDLGIGEKIKGDLDEIVKLSNADFKIKMGAIDDRLTRQQLADQKKARDKVDRENKQREKEDLRNLKATQKEALRLLKEKEKEKKRLKEKNDRETKQKQKEEVRDLLSEYKRLSSQKSSLLKQSAGTVTTDVGYNTLQRNLKDVQGELDKTSIKLAKYGINLTKAFDDNTALKGTQDTVRMLEKISKQVISTSNTLKSLSSSSHVDGSALGGMAETLERISHLDADASVEELVVALKQLEAIQSKLGKVKSAIVDTKGYEKASDFIEDYMQKLRKLQREDGQFLNPLAVDQFVASLHNLNNVPLDKLQHEQKQVTRNFRDMADEVKYVSHEVQNGFFANLYDNLASFQLGDLIGDAIREGVYAVVQGVRDFDSAIRDYRKVAEDTWIDTPKELKQIGVDAIKIAKEVGMSSNDVVLAMADTIQAGIGKTKADIEEVSKMSMMLANVGDVTQEQASQYFNSILSAFQYSDGKSWASKPLKEVEVFVDGVVKKTTQLEKVTDILNYVGNEYSITSSGIAEALMRSGSVMSTYGVSYEQSVAMITGANASIQNPEKIGNGLKTITMRMAGLTYKTKEGKIALNSTGDALQKIAKIELIDAKTGKLKNVFQMVDELKDKWSSLTEQEQRALTEAMAGKQQANIMASLLNNWEMVEDVMGNISDSSANFFGSATKENAQYMDSIEGKINKLKETWKETYTTIISSDFAKGVLDIAIKVSEGITKLVVAIDKAKLSIPALALGFLNLKNAISFMGTGGARGSIGGIFSGGIFDGNNWRRFGNDLKNSSHAIDGFEKASSNLKGTGVKLGSGLNNLSGGIGTVVTTTTNATGKLGGFGSGMKLALSSINPLNMALGLFSGVVQAGVIFGLTKAIEKTGEWVYANYNARVEIDKSIASHRDELSTLDHKQKVLDKVGKRYDELKKKAELTGQEEAELKDITRELINIFPELKPDNYDPENPIILTSKDAKQLADELQRAIDKKKELLRGDIKKKGDTAWTKVHVEDDKKNDLSILEKLKRDSNLYEAIVNTQKFQRQKAINNVVNSKGEAEFQANLKKLREVRENEEKLRSEAYTTYLTQYKDFQGRVKEISDSAFAELQDSNKWENFNEKTKTGLESAFKSFDFTGFKDQTQVTQFIDAFADSVGKGGFKLEDFNKKLVDLKSAYNDTGNLEAYNKGIDELVNTLDKATKGKFDKKILKEMFDMDFDPSVTRDKLEAYMRTFGATAEMGVNDVNNKLILGFESLQRTLNTLTDPASYTFNKKTQKWEIDVELVTEILKDPDLPQQIKSTIEQMSKDGLDQTEVMTVVTLSTILEQGNVEGADKVLAQIQGILDGKEKPTADIKLGTQTISKESLELMQGLNKTLGDNPIDIKALLNIEDVKKKSNEAKDKTKGIPDKTVKIKGDNHDANKKVVDTKKKVDQVRDKTISVKADTGGAVKNITLVQDKVKNTNSKTITLSVLIKETVQKAITWLTGGAKKPSANTDRSSRAYYSEVSTQPTTPSFETSSPTTMTFGGTSISPSPTMNFGGSGAVNTTGMTASGVSTFATKKASTPKYTPADDVYFNEIDWLIRSIDLQKQLENAIAKVNTQLEINREKQKYAYGSNKIALMREEVKILQQQVSLNQQLEQNLKNEQGSLKGFLDKKGFKFDSTGNLTNYVAKMQELNNWIKGSKSEGEYESRTKQVNEIKTALEEYMNVTFTQIPQAQQEWQGLSNSIKDAYAEQVQVAKEMEDKVIEMYRKQIDEKKKAIQEELKLTEEALDKKIEAINKEKEAYNKAREEDNWQEDYAEKQEELLKLQEKMNLLSRDTSASGKSKYADIKEEYDKALEDINKMVQDKADQKVNETFDKEAEKLQLEKEMAQEMAEKSTENLDSKYTDEYLRELANKDVYSGKFIDIDGKVHNLKDSMIEFLNSTGEGLGAMGEQIKNEMVANLLVAQDTLKDMGTVMSSMGLTNYTNDSGIFKEASPTQSRPITPAMSEAFKVLEQVLKASSGIVIPSQANRIQYGEKSPAQSFVFHESLVTITGNADMNTVAQLEKLAKEIEQKVTSSIVSYIK